ncbi:MAG: hypothetical protein ACR2GY_13305 [Phycisphaerales bacterium]
MSSASPLTRTQRNRRPRRENQPINQPDLATPVFITSVAPAGTNVTLTFDQSVSLNGTPAFTTDVAGATVVSASQSSPNVVVLTFSADVSLASQVNIPPRDEAIRGSRGGYVTATVVLV